MLIRKITADDNIAIAAIIRNSLLEFHAARPGTVYYDESTDHLSDVFRAKRSAYFILEIDGEVGGGAGIYPTKNLPADTCELVKIYIAPPYRGKGYGQMLLEKCISEAKKQGFKKMYLESMPELKTAISMYHKNGFSNIPKPLGNSGHTGCEVWMIKDL
jgi:putative acetyltransferase